MSARTEAGRRNAENWLAYGAAVERTDAMEFVVMHQAAREEFAARMSADAAIAYAILEANEANATTDLDLVADLLDYAAMREDADSRDLDFIAFFRPIVAERIARQAALDAAVAEAQSLRQQLNALRALEEQLDAGD